MKKLIESLRLFKRDKWVLIFSLIPVVIGLVIYGFFGQWLLTDVYAWGMSFVDEKVEGGWLSALSWLIIAILSITVFFVVNWTFVIVVSIVAAPFNDLISERVEKILTGEQTGDVSDSIKKMIGRFAHVLINELKKIILIIFVALLGFLFSFIFPPISLLISVVLLAVEFLDYSWGRDELSVTQCLSDLKKSFLTYSYGGLIFLFIVGIPILNLIALPLGVVYFTCLYVEKNKLLRGKC